MAPDREAVLAAFINVATSLPEHTAFVLDDYHLTVKKHVSNLCAKLGVSNRTEAQPEPGSWTCSASRHLTSIPHNICANPAQIFSGSRAMLPTTRRFASTFIAETGVHR